MTYQVIWSERSRKDLERLDKSISQRIISKVDGMAEDPFIFVNRLKGIPIYSLRIGDYRALLDIENKRMIIFVIRVEHRKKVYEDI